MATAPQLFAAAHGQSDDGPHRCFYCGAACSGAHRAADWRSDAFTAWSSVAAVSSPFVCTGCTLSLNERAVMPGRDKPQKMRNYSWLITPTRAVPASKADMAAQREWCLRPPADEPCAIVLAVSGQRPLIYMAAVNAPGAATATVQLETERITYAPADLSDRLSLCRRISAACGKMVLQDEPTGALAARLADYYGEIEPIEPWFYCWAEPLSRLAAYLCPAKDECADEHPKRDPAPTRDVRRQPVAATSGGTDGPGLFG